MKGDDLQLRAIRDDVVEVSRLLEQLERVAVNARGRLDRLEDALGEAGAEVESAADGSALVQQLAFDEASSIARDLLLILDDEVNSRSARQAGQELVAALDLALGAAIG